MKTVSRHTLISRVKEGLKNELLPGRSQFGGIAADSGAGNVNYVLQWWRLKTTNAMNAAPLPVPGRGVGVQTRRHGRQDHQPGKGGAVASSRPRGSWRCATAGTLQDHQPGKANGVASPWRRAS